MAVAIDTLSFMLSLLLWELGLNVLSARVQAAVVHDNPSTAGPWLVGAIFLGAATGPLLHGWAIQAVHRLFSLAMLAFLRLFPLHGFT